MNVNVFAKKTGQTDRETDGRQTEFTETIGLHFPVDAASVIIKIMIFTSYNMHSTVSRKSRIRGAGSR